MHLEKWGAVPLAVPGFPVFWQLRVHSGIDSPEPKFRMLLTWTFLLKGMCCSNFGTGCIYIRERSKMMSDVFWVFGPTIPPIRFRPISAHAPILWCPILTLKPPPPFLITLYMNFFYRRFPKFAILFQFSSYKIY